MKTIHALAALAALLAASARADKPAATSASIFRADVLKNIDAVEKKLLGLAEATPEEKYSFRPEKGVRSTAEVFMHVAGANYFLATFLGAKVPEGLSLNFDTSASKKAEIIEHLKASCAHARKAVEKVPEADFTKPIKMFGSDSHLQSAMFVIANHLHEHLGQAIAYARMSGVKPPWSKGD